MAKKTSKKRSAKPGAKLKPRKKDNPKYLEALKTAKLLENTGQLQQAANGYAHIINMAPDHYEANSSLGQLLHKINRNQEALNYLRHAEIIRPNDFNATWNVFIVERALNLLIDAEKSLKKLYKLEPDNILFLLTYGVFSTDTNKPDRARKLYDQAVKLAPNNALAHAKRGSVQKVQGDFAAAELSFRKAIALDAGCASAHHGLAFLQKCKEHNDDVKAMELASQLDTLKDPDRMLLEYALGKVFDDLSEYDKAFDHLLEANRLRRQTYQYCVPDQKKYFKQHELELGAAFQQRFEGKGLEDSTPIFIVGMPRSGTSLTEQILASHSSVHGAGEVEYIRQVCEVAMTITRQEFPAGLNQVNEGSFVTAASQYIEKLRNGVDDSILRVTDKLPHNFLRVGLIAAVFPQAKIIHCVRNPLDHCLSIFQQDFNVAHGYAANLQELAEYYRLYESLMAFWHELLPDKIYCLSYEKLIADPDNQVKELLNYCELPFEQACMNFHKTKRNVNTPSASQVRKPMYKTAVEKWKNYEQQLQPLADILNRTSH
ncbi:tetratricopeptide repeat-containing sulfotransferase family protein [Oceanicoccus sagamiensis]|uniref:Uncharacterized protein n=1 Tax=Oceanicoccus sagamiensis TaxID=716816 RepID=A0A1X9NGE1_9GAMM|nr:tetratricopeptide repeat-containing sulfotransferase family protein [Oceanicoccus sagamiensis]ARN73083.1 hypothetical protein BST96_02550 [Oceanicoccus sagamiensis]